MIAFVTSCGRFDLLSQTLKSLYENKERSLEVIINEDGHAKRGQHACIGDFVKNSHPWKYYLHVEDDWHFSNSYDWITASVAIMEADPKVIKVLAREDSPHPCVYDHALMGSEIYGLTEHPEADAKKYFSIQKFGYLKPWTGNDGIKWHGFSWNPGVTRMDLLSEFIPFKRWEQEVAEDIYNAGYKVVALEQGVYKHIGDGRSTHQ